MKILYFDIETSPCLSWVWSTGKQYVGHNQIMEPTKIICISYKFSGDKKVKNLQWSHKQCDKQMLKKFCKIAEKADIIMGHNGKSFDLKHINARVAFHRLKPFAVAMIEDTLMMSRKQFKLPSHSLDYLAKYFDVGAKMETGGINLWLDVWLKNDKKALKKMVKYCDMDVIVLEAVYERLKPYVETRINVSESNRECPSCKGKLHKHDKRRISQFKLVQRYRCKDCGKVVKGGQNLLKHTAKLPRA